MPHTFQDIWHPPADKAMADGRVNLKGQPMLYTTTKQIPSLIITLYTYFDYVFKKKRFIC